MQDGAIVVLGSPNDENGNLYSVARERCDGVRHLHDCNPDWPILPTGGFGDHFNTTSQPHAHYLRSELIAQGVPATRFLQHAESRNTLEDASLSKPILTARRVRTAVVVTSDYHIARARFVFRREFADTRIVLFFIGVQTDEASCELDLPELKRHEREALQRLRKAAS